MSREGGLNGPVRGGSMMALAAEAQRLLLLAHRQVLRSSRDEMGNGSRVGVGQAFDLHAR